MIDTLLFDLGGVVLESPLEAISVYEEDNFLPQGTVNRGVVRHGDAGAWARHERGEIGFVEFCNLFEAEMAADGFVVDAASLLAQIESFSVPRMAVLEEIERLRRAGLKLGAVTNNWESMDVGGIADRFDVVVESSVEGVRKPEPEIFVRALARLQAKAETALMFDDLGVNLKAARALGMETFKVTSEAALVERLGELGQS